MAKKPGALGRFLDKPTRPEDVPPPEAGKPIRRKRNRRQLSDGRIPFQGYIMPEGLKELKLLAIEEDRPYSDLVAEAIDDLLAKYGRPQLARPAPE